MADFSGMDYLNSYFSTGAFVCVKDNVMTASWGFVGCMWGKKCVIVPIRDSRYTKKLLDESTTFTVSIPKAGAMSKALGICGSKSGRDTDKWAVAEIEKQGAKAVDTNVVKGCEHYFECVIRQVVPMNSFEGLEKMYSTGDKHNFYIGEVVEEY